MHKFGRAALQSWMDKTDPGMGKTDALDPPPSTDETKKAISQMNSNKATGQDGIPAEI